MTILSSIASAIIWRNRRTGSVRSVFIASCTICLNIERTISFAEAALSAAVPQAFTRAEAKLSMLELILSPITASMDASLYSAMVSLICSICWRHCCTRLSSVFFLDCSSVICWSISSLCCSRKLISSSYVLLFWVEYSFLRRRSSCSLSF